jgi:phosphatidylglycerol---prolipoprotein diacylglyceryl transferase
MTFPFNLHIGKLEIPVHMIFEILAYTIGFRYFLFLRKKQTDTISSDNRLWIMIGAAAGALIFSRLIGIFEDPEKLSALNLQYLLANKTIVGGLVGGLIGTEITKKYLGVSNSSGDLLTYPLILAMIIGRTGCFLQGLEDGTFGNPSSVLWAIDFGDGIRRHPTNLYEILFLLLLFSFIKVSENKYELKDGTKFKLFMAGYLLFRFLIEFIKPRYVYIYPLSLIQIVCLFTLIYYYRLLLYPAKYFNLKRNPAI